LPLTKLLQEIVGQQKIEMSGDRYSLGYKQEKLAQVGDSTLSIFTHRFIDRMCERRVDRCFSQNKTHCFGFDLSSVAVDSHS